MLKNVIITGGTGFIGRWMIKELLNNGINVTAIVRDKARLCQEYLKDNRFDYIEGDISTWIYNLNATPEGRG